MGSGLRSIFEPEREYTVTELGGVKWGSPRQRMGLLGMGYDSVLRREPRQESVRGVFHAETRGRRHTNRQCAARKNGRRNRRTGMEGKTDCR